MTKQLHRLSDNVKLLQKAVVMHQGKLLLLQRSESSKTRALQWDLPGGNSEWPTEKEGIIRDLHITDLKREILEETGISADSFATAPELVSFETCFEAEKNMYTVIVGWYIVLSNDFDKDTVKLSDEHDKREWISANEVKDYDLGFAGGETGFITRIIANALQM